MGYFEREEEGVEFLVRVGRGHVRAAESLSVTYSVEYHVSMVRSSFGERAPSHHFQSDPYKRDLILLPSSYGANFRGHVLKRRGHVLLVELTVKDGSHFRPTQIRLLRLGGEE